MASSRSRLDARGGVSAGFRRGRPVSRRSAAMTMRQRSGEPAIRLFGPPAVRVDASWEALRPGKSSALVAYVAHRSAPVRRAEIAALLWPEVDEQRAHTNLRQLLKGLSSGALAACIERDRDSVRSAIVSDAVAFERALDEARWSDAVTLYQGPLLEGFDEVDAGEFASWLASERAVAEGRWRHACLALLDDATAEDWAARALQITDRMLRVDPLDEVAVRHAMRAAAAVGDTVAARQRFEHFRDALARDLGVAPEAATQGLAEQLERIATVASNGSAVALTGGTVKTLGEPGTARGPTGRPLGRLPGRRLIGRAAALRDLADLVERDDVRVLTLLGLGGMGKTTLAWALADVVGERFEDGVVFAALDEVEVSELVAAVAQAAGVVLIGASAPLEQLAAALGTRRMLLVLDGIEPHLEHVSLVDALVRACPHLTVVVTSRSRLRLSTEVVFEVGPLATAETVHAPDDGERGASAAAGLFLRTAARVGVRLAPTADELDAIERICDAVGGNPLAIELVAAWTDVLSVAEVERQVHASWDLLRSDDVDRGSRHGDLHMALAATWEHLPSEDRVAWARLAVLPGSLDRALAATVAGTGWRGLRRLVDAALLAHRGDRLVMHALVMRFGRERATAEGFESGAWETSLEVWRERLATGAERAAPAPPTWHEHDLDQALAAWRWCLAQARDDDAAALAVGLLRALGRSGRSVDQARAVADAVRLVAGREGPVRDRILARVLPFAGGDPLEAADAARQALDLARSTGDALALGCALTTLLRVEPSVEAEDRFEEARSVLSGVGDERGVLEALLGHADVLLAKGRLSAGEALLREAQALADALGDRLARASVIHLHGVADLIRGEAEAASDRLAAARRLYASEGAVYRGSGTLANEAWLAFLEGDRAAAERHVEAFVASERRHRDARVVGAALRSALYARFGEHARVVVEAEEVLRRYGSAGRPSVLGFFAHQRAARALAGLGEVRRAAEHLRQAVAFARACDAPRFVARVVLSAAALAAAAGADGAARAFLACARAHPSLERVLDDDLRAIEAMLEDAVGGPLAEQPPGLTDPSPEAGEDDAALLARVERLLDAIDAPP